MHDKKLAAMPVSYMMAFCEVFQLGNVVVAVDAGLMTLVYLSLATGTGGAIGVVWAITAFNKINKEKIK